MSTDPAPVEVTNTEPMPVNVVAGTEHTTPDTTAQTTAKTTQAAARVDADILRTEDQRRISGIWERTQQIIALSVVEAALLVACVKSIQASVDGNQPSTEAGVAFVFLASVANLVIGFYFGRTNHTRVGGAATRDEADRGR